MVRRHRHHRSPAPAVVLPRDRLRTSHRAVPRRATTRAPRRGRGPHAVVLDRRRLQLELGRQRRGSCHGGGLCRRGGGRAGGERPVRRSPTERRGAPLPVRVRDHVRTGCGGGDRLPGRGRNRPHGDAVRRGPGVAGSHRRPCRRHRRPRGPGVRDIAACGRGRRAARDAGPRNRGPDRGARRAGGTGQRQPRHRGGLQPDALHDLRRSRPGDRPAQR